MKLNESNYYVKENVYSGYNTDSGFMGKVFYDNTNIAFYKYFASESDYKDLFDNDDKK